MRIRLLLPGLPPEYWDADDIALEIPEHPNIWTDGSREDFSSIGGFEVAGAGVYLPAAEVAFDHSVWGTVEEYGDARLEDAVLFYLSLGFCRLFSVLNSGVLLLLCRLTGLVIWVLTTLMWFVTLDVCLMLIAELNLPLVKDGDLIALVQYMIRTRGRDTVRVTKVKGHFFFVERIAEAS